MIYVVTAFLWILSVCYQHLIPDFFGLSTVILTVYQNLTIRFLPHFPLKEKYQILTEEGGLIDKR